METKQWKKNIDDTYKELKRKTAPAFEQARKHIDDTYKELKHRWRDTWNLCCINIDDTYKELKLGDNQVIGILFLY